MQDSLGNFGVNANIAVHDLRDLKVYTQAHDVDSLHGRHTCHHTTPHHTTPHHMNDYAEAMVWYMSCLPI